MNTFWLVAHICLMRLAQLLAHALNASLENKPFHPQVLEIKQCGFNKISDLFARKTFTIKSNTLLKYYYINYYLGTGIWFWGTLFIYKAVLILI
jgi:hypothetical protein